MRKKTLYISDLDGTLLDNSGKLPHETVEIINDAIRGGVLFSYATARSFATASVVTKGLECRVPVILNSGVFIKNPETGEIIESRMIDKTLFSPVAAAIEEVRIPALVFSVIDGMERVSWLENDENKGIKSYLSSRRDDKRLRPVSDYKSLFDGEIMQLTIISHEAETREFTALCDRTDYCRYSIMQDTYDREEWWLEIYRNDADKASAALRLKEMLGADRLVAFGDNVNDLPMFAVSDECYAVENALPEVKAAATGVIGTNMDCGVARWLRDNVIL